MSGIDLDDLFEFANTVASTKIVGQTEPVSFYVLLNATGERRVVDATDDNWYEEIYTRAGLREPLCDRDTIAYIFFGHALLRPHASGEPFTQTRPGDHRDDREVVLVVAADGVDKYLRHFALRRDNSGIITALEEFSLK